MSTEFHVPPLGEGIYEAELVEWLVAPGQQVARGQPLMEVMTDKAVMPIPSPFAGVIQELLAEPGRAIAVGQPVLTYESGEPQTLDQEPKAETEVAETEVPEQEPIDMHGERVQAAPVVRRRARELGVDLASVPGTGPGGRVLLSDLEGFASTAVEERTAPPPTPRRSSATFPLPLAPPGSRIPLRGLRRTIAETMSRAKQTIPHYSLVDECDVTALVQLREMLKPKCERASVKLTYLSFMVRAAVEALQEIPLINASLDEAAEEITLHDRYHIGFATATPQGLIVPVIHDADRMSVLEIAREVERLSAEARSGKVRLADVRGATFTITSIGNIGGLISTPIIPPPQVAIMGVGKIVRRPVYDEHGNLRPADLLYLSFSFDHRVIDGDVGARFANAVIARLQAPATLLV